MSYRWLKWLAALVLALPLLAALWIALNGWNWARAPLQRTVQDRTGRALVIGGDLTVKLGWPTPTIRARAVTFANPSWATEQQMIAVDDVEFTLDLPALLRRELVFPQVHLKHPLVFLERAPDGRKTWLLDHSQTDENARVPIGRLTLDDGQLGYDDAQQRTRIRVNLSTQQSPDGAAPSNDVLFAASGHYKGLALAARGRGGSVLALHDESAPYPLSVDAAIARTSIKAEGSVTSPLKLSAADLKLTLRGDSLAQLFPLLGIALPQTHPYATTGHLVHAGQSWRYEKFSGHFGNSDIAGTLALDLAGKRPQLRGELLSRRLALDDLGPVVGAKEHKGPAASAPAASAKVLPDIAFKTERWDTVDADVTLRAATLERSRELPLENLLVHLTLQDAVLKLDPLDFGLAGGHLKSKVLLDGRAQPIQAHASVAVQQVRLAKLFPTIALAQSSAGEINGKFELGGRGNSVGAMLGSADGRVALLLANGEISKLLMEKTGLHLLEILQLKLFGDKTVKLRCVVADFDVKAGVMRTSALVLDTEINTIIGSGSIDLAREQLDLTFLPKTRTTSPIALRSPIHVSGSFGAPVVQLDTARVAARGLGAVALALLNPVLAVAALVELGPGLESPCQQLIQDAKTPGNKAPRASAPATAK